ncbi:MAG: acyl-CoA thioesterase [Bacteroidaceae bacterium]|nr:acyl-CoA thioesterase [Bacteroidaceae bacterium]
MKKKHKQRPAALVNRTRIRVRFSEVDSMNVVWHGEYVRYFEDGRQAFGREYGIDYSDFIKYGYVAPIVDLKVQYKRSLTFSEEAIIETRYIACDTAKLIFDYIIYRAEDMSVAATGSSEQVFLNKNGEMELNSPLFYKEWKEKWQVEQQHA